MSIQEEPVRYAFPEQTSSSSNVIHPGKEEYDPFAIDDDDVAAATGMVNHVPSTSTTNEQFNQHERDTVQPSNGSSTSPVMINSKRTQSPTSDKSVEQQPVLLLRSPVQHRSKHADRGSRSPNHQSSDRKRLRPSSPVSSVTVPTPRTEPSKSTRPYRNDVRSKSPLSPVTSTNSSTSTKKPPESNYEKRSSSSDVSKPESNHSRHSSTRDEPRSYRSQSSRHHRPHPSAHASSRHHATAPQQSDVGRRTNDSHANSSSPSRTSSLPADTRLSPTNNNAPGLTNHETSTEDRNRIYNRLRNANEINASIVPTANHEPNKSSLSAPAFTNSNGASQRSRSNLIQIRTTEAALASNTRLPPMRSALPQVKSDSVQAQSGSLKPLSTSSKLQSTNGSTPQTNGKIADDMLMEEMLLEEEQEQCPVKPIDLDSLTISATKKSDKKQEPVEITSTTVKAATTAHPPVPSLTPSPTKKPYTLYKVPHTNHTTPPLSSRHRKQPKNDTSTAASARLPAVDSTTPAKASSDDLARRTSLDDRISNLLRVPSSAANGSSNEQQPVDHTQTSAAAAQTLSTPSDKSTESPQDIPSLISTMFKKGQEHAVTLKKVNSSEERRSTTSKHYTSEWLASQKPEDASAPAEETATLPPLVTLPTLVGTPISQTSANGSSVPQSSTGEVTMFGKLSEAMGKLIQKQGDTAPPALNESEDAVPISAKHLERLERRKQREKRQTEIAAIAKEALKPAFKKHDITKDEYKEIMKKVVTKATPANEIDRVRIGKMIDAYIKQYRSLRQQKAISKPSSTSNGKRE